MRDGAPLGDRDGERSARFYINAVEDGADGRDAVIVNASTVTFGLSTTIVAGAVNTPLALSLSTAQPCTTNE